MVTAAPSTQCEALRPLVLDSSDAPQLCDQPPVPWLLRQLPWPRSLLRVRAADDLVVDTESAKRGNRCVLVHEGRSRLTEDAER
jgi:hypothetical protein